MKRIKKLPLLLTAIILFVTALIGLFCGDGGKVYAYYDPYEFEYVAFHADYDVRADRTMDVTLNLGVHYMGYSSTGLLFDIPVNAGDRVRHVTACELNGGIDGEEIHLDYDVTNEESELITVDMGDRSLKTGETHYYRIKYTYAITRPAASEKNMIALNALGGGHQADISDFRSTVKLPDGFIGNKTVCYFGSVGSTNKYDNVKVEGNTVTVTADSVPQRNAFTLELYFNEGVLSVKPDMTPYWIIIAACVLLAVLFAVKLIMFNKDGLTPVTNVEAPNDMDPLVMGKLIDNRVDNSDVTSLIYYWANKGYLNINFKSERDIELIRIHQTLPDDSPNYQKVMYNSLFRRGDIVAINSLTNNFYTTVQKVTSEVNSENGKLYDGKSTGVAVLFALIGALFMGVAPIILTLFGISTKLFIISPLFMVIPAFIVFALAQTVRHNRLKYKKSGLAVRYLLLALLSLAISAIYVLFVPSYIIEILPKCILCVIGFAIIILSTTIISRTDAYREKLNQIVGFRNFILYAEKDRLETMLEQNPEFYYQVLPYAIVLGVSDIWENKFAALTVAPPSWATMPTGTLFRISVFNSVMRNASTRMTTAMTSRPSSGSYSGGSHGGGGGGGFSGGGHGGGGSRGR